MEPAKYEIVLAEKRERKRLRYRGFTQEGHQYADVILRKDPCSYCGAPFGAADHIDAHSVGGPGTPDNLTASCTNCNLVKGKTPLLLFLLTN